MINSTKRSGKLQKKLDKLQVSKDTKDALEEIINTVREHSDCFKLIILFSMALRDEPELFGIIRENLRSMTEDLHYFEMGDTETEKNVLDEVLPFAIIHHFCQNDSFYIDRLYDIHKRLEKK